MQWLHRQVSAWLCCRRSGTEAEGLLPCLDRDLDASQNPLLPVFLLCDVLLMKKPQVDAFPVL